MHNKSTFQTVNKNTQGFPTVQFVGDVKISFKILLSTFRVIKSYDSNTNTTRVSNIRNKNILNITCFTAAGLGVETDWQSCGCGRVVEMRKSFVI